MMSIFLTKNIRNKNYINRNKKVVLYNKTFFKIFLMFSLLIVITIFCTKITKNYKFSKFTNMMNDILVYKGFLVENILITGNNIVPKGVILDNFQDLRKKNIFSIDLLQIYKGLLLNKWIKDLEVKRILPNTIKINITEQKAMAIWQTKSGNKLISPKGNVILVTRINNFKNQLPIITGEKANQNALKILKVLKQNPQLYTRIWSISYISKRRWDIHFKEGLTILLPKDDIEKAWLRIQHLQKKYNILELGLTEIDIRNKNQILGKVDVDKKFFLVRKKLL